MATATPAAEVSSGELVRRALDALNRHDIEALKQFWTEETVERFPDRTCRGAEEIAAYFEEAFAALPDWHMEILAVVEEGEDVLVHWHLGGTHRGPVLGIEPTGKRLEIDGMDHFVVREGKIASNFVVFDQLQYARQIGMMPVEGSAADRALKAAFNVRTRVLQRIRGS